MRKKLLLIFVFIIIFSGFAVNALKNNCPINLIINEKYDMVIIAPSKFKDALQPLIDHKNKHDMQTFLKTTEEIYSEFKGRDEPEQIKYFIKEAIETHDIDYVLLVGGRKGQSFRWYVPVRYSNVDDGFMHKQFLSDLYFADIYNENSEFEDWDSNDNGIFAEWYSNSQSSNDIMDLKPDVSVGRLPCRYKIEVTSIVKKIINYENNVNGKSWFNKILLVGGDTNPGVGEPFPYEGEVDCQWILQYLDGFKATKLFTSDGSLTGLNDFLSAFNKGYGFVYYAGHGLQDELCTYLPNGQKPITIMHNKYTIKLKNNKMFPVTVVGCCLTTEFDVGIFNFLQIFKNFKQHHYFFNFIHECVFECIGWNMVSKPNVGSIAHIGCSSTSWGSTGDKNNDSIPDAVQDGFTVGLCTEFFRLFGEEGKRIIGEIHINALTNNIENHSARQDRVQCKCVQEFQLIGDPSLKIGGY